MDYRVNDTAIKEGLASVAELGIMIARLEQVNPANPIITRAMVKSIMCYAFLEQMIAVQSRVIAMDPNTYRQLQMELKRIVKTNL